MHHTVSLQLMTMNERPQQRKNEMHEQEPHPASQFTENAAAFFFSDDKELAGLFTDRLMTGHCADPVRLETAMQERGVSDTLEIVSLNGVGEIEVPADSATEQTKYLLTQGLNGCSATVIVHESPDGTRRVQMTHSPDFSVDRQLHNIGIGPQSESGSGKTSSLIFAQAKRQSGVPQLQELIKQIAKDGVLQVQTYESDTRNPESGVLIVKVPPSSTKAPVEFFSWQGKGVI